MSKRKTAYREEWEIDFYWLTKYKEKTSKAYCTICKRSFIIDNPGLAQVRAHAGADGHKNKVKVISGTTSQRVFATSNNDKISLGSNKNILLSTEDQVIRAETHCVKRVQIRSYLWSVFSYVQIEYGDLLRKSPYSMRIQENTDQK